MGVSKKKSPYGEDWIVFLLFIIFLLAIVSEFFGLKIDGSLFTEIMGGPQNTNTSGSNAASGMDADTGVSVSQLSTAFTKVYHTVAEKYESLPSTEELLSKLNAQIPYLGQCRVPTDETASASTITNNTNTDTNASNPVVTDIINKELYKMKQSMPWSVFKIDPKDQNINNNKGVGPAPTEQSQTPKQTPTQLDKENIPHNLPNNNLKNPPAAPKPAPVPKPKLVESSGRKTVDLFSRIRKLPTPDALKELNQIQKRCPTVPVFPSSENFIKPPDKGDYDSIAERYAMEFCQRLYRGKKFAKIRPDWLKYPKTNRNQELDGYNEELKLAIEVNGPHHFSWPNHLDQTREQYESQKARDQFKYQVCRERGIDLILMPTTFTYEKIPLFLYATILELHLARQ